MRKRLENYLKYMEKMKEDPWYKEMSYEEREHIRQELLAQISFFQHERLIHLIVTAVFAFITIAALIGSCVTYSMSLIIMTVLCLALTIPYVMHYYFLENGVQKLYEYYDAICMR